MTDTRRKELKDREVCGTRISHMDSSLWLDDYEVFDQATEQFYRREIDAKAYKGISGGFGSYAQRGAEANMLRLRLPGGRIDQKKLKFLADSIKKYQVNKVHVTTCQTVSQSLGGGCMRACERGRTKWGDHERWRWRLSEKHDGFSALRCRKRRVF